MGPNIYSANVDLRRYLKSDMGSKSGEDRHFFIIYDQSVTHLLTHLHIWIRLP